MEIMDCSGLLWSFYFINIFVIVLLLFTIIFGLYGLVIGGFLILVHLCSVNTFGKPYLFPVAPMDRTYLFKTLLKNNKDNKRSNILSDNRTRGNV